MELKYPKLSVGIKLMYASWWCALIGAVAGFVGGIASAFAGIGVALLAAVVLEFTVAILELVVYGLQVAGLHKAAKDAGQYKTVFHMLVTELVISAVLIVVLLIQSYMLLIVVGVVGGLICAVLEPLRMCLFVKYTEELVQENGDAGVKGYYKAIRNCFFIALGGILVGSVIDALEVASWIGFLLIVVAMFSALACWILYGVFLHNTNKFFKTLEKTEAVHDFEGEQILQIET